MGFIDFRESTKVFKINYCCMTELGGSSDFLPVSMQEWWFFWNRIGGSTREEATHE
jgi:hypothetical protein